MRTGTFAIAAAIAWGAIGAGAQSTKPAAPAAVAQKPAGTTAPIIVIETLKGTVEIQLLPAIAPKSVAHLVDLVRKRFYRGLRVHRVERSLVQLGDPQSRNVGLKAFWGSQGSGMPIGVAEISKTESHVRGAVGLAYAGDFKDGAAKNADSQFYILKTAAPSLDGRYAIVGHVIKGMDVVDQWDVGEVIRNCYLKGEGPK